MSNNFGYLDIILLVDCRFYNLAIKKHIRRKTGHESKVYPNFAEKEFSMPQKDTKVAKQNLKF